MCGFYNDKSCLTNLLEFFFNNISKHMDRDDPVNTVYLDFEST